MRRLIIAAVAVVALVAPAPAAYAERDRGRGHDNGGDYREGCGRGGGGCNNEREENYENTGCKYVCPSFDKSPVHDAFNFSPTVCLPGSTCNFDGRKSDERNPEETPAPQ